MAQAVEHPGRLIAIDGTRGKDTAAAAATVIAALKKAGIECAISRFDASGLFGELATAGRGDRNISIRTLTLVYAADLAFRLRWEIRPVLEAGGVVIAAPYLETAVAFGVACGLAEGWIRELLRFAPRPDLRARVEERKLDRGWKPRLDRGYPEYCAAMLERPAPKLASKRARRETMTLLDRPRGRKVVRLTEKGVQELVKIVTGSLPGAPRRSASKPRSGRK
jgi:hypothetical protein